MYLFACFALLLLYSLWLLLVPQGWSDKEARAFLKGARRFGDLRRHHDIMRAAALEKPDEQVRMLVAHLAGIVTAALESDDIKKARLLGVSFNPRELHQVRSGV